MYQAPWGIEVSGNVFGRQGYPFPIFRRARRAALGADSALTVLVTPEIDTFRYPNLWNTDLRVAQTFKVEHGHASAAISTCSTCSTRTRCSCGQQRRDRPTSFNAIAQNLSPRISRVGSSSGF